MVVIIAFLAVVIIIAVRLLMLSTKVCEMCLSMLVCCLCGDWFLHLCLFRLGAVVGVEVGCAHVACLLPGNLLHS